MILSLEVTYNDQIGLRHELLVTADTADNVTHKNCVYNCWGNIIDGEFNMPVEIRDAYDKCLLADDLNFSDLSDNLDHYEWEWILSDRYNIESYDYEQVYYCLSECKDALESLPFSDETVKDEFSITDIHSALCNTLDEFIYNNGLLNKAWELPKFIFLNLQYPHWKMSYVEDGGLYRETAKSLILEKYDIYFDEKIDEIVESDSDF